MQQKKKSKSKQDSLSFVRDCQHSDFYGSPLRWSHVCHDRRMHAGFYSDMGHYQMGNPAHDNPLWRWLPGNALWPSFLACDCWRLLSFCYTLRYLLLLLCCFMCNVGLRHQNLSHLKRTHKKKNENLYSTKNKHEKKIEHS